MIRLLIADDHTIVRDGLRQLFALFHDLCVVGEAANGSQVLDLIRQSAPDLVLLDVTMPGINGADLIDRIVTRHPQLPVIMLSMHGESQVATRMLKAGARGYVTKDSDSETLLRAIRHVASGGRFISPQLAQEIAFAAGNTDNSPPHHQLTDRELQILRLLAKGLGLNDIADQLAISNKTVSTHKTRLMKKMNITSNANLIRYAVDHHLVD